MKVVTVRPLTFSYRLTEVNAEILMITINVLIAGFLLYIRKETLSGYV